ncbi:MAG: AAA family ATPase, partial [Cyanobacteria bacterium K_DeepCast_35m_m1_288]|nr:AAA family ATPase [Cyanobacteria bacterium K_DeepCast_35m_m1_288]
MTLDQSAVGVQPIGAQPSLGLDFQASEAVRFLEQLGKDPAQTWLRFLKPTGGGGGADQKGISTQKHQAQVQQRVVDGLNVYAVIGTADKATGKGGGVLDADITQCPALFVEWDDGAAIDEQMQRWQALGLPEPSVMVATGGKSVHCYWVLVEPISAAEWKRITARLIAHCNSDKQCSNPSRVMRLPGSVYYDKKTGKATGHCSILSSAGTRYTAADIKACLPAPKPQGNQLPSLKPVTAAPSHVWPPRSIDEINAAAEYIPRRVRGEGTYEADRNALCGCSAALDKAGHPDPDSAALALLGHLWPTEAEARQVLASTTTRKADSFWSVAGEHGYNLSRSSKTAKPVSKATSSKPEPRTFEQNWELLELHAAELACGTWPVMKAVASMAVKASELEIPRLGQRQLEQLLEQAQRRIRAKTEPVLGGGVFTIKATPWAVEGIFRHGLNLLTGQSGAGKSRLAAACMAAWLRGDATWLQRKLQGDDPRHRHALIIGTDQTLEDWHLTLGPVGLTQKLDATTVKTHDRLTLYGLESGVQLDADGLNIIRRWVDAHPGGMVLIDSLAQCLPPGVDEDKSSAARPVHQLQEALGDAWGILTHHTRKGAGKEGNLGVGAGRGSGAIDAAVSRVVG